MIESAISSTSGKDGILPTVYDVAFRDKMRSCEIRKTLSLELLLGKRKPSHVATMLQEILARLVLPTTPMGTHWAVTHLAWKKESVAEGQLLISLFNIKPHFLLRLEIDRLILRWCQGIISAKFRRYTEYPQYLLLKAAMLVFCMECSETLVATSSLIN